MIRVLRLIEYRYEDAETMTSDMARWTIQSPPSWMIGRMSMRSVALPAMYDPAEWFPEVDDAADDGTSPQA